MKEQTRPVIIFALNTRNDIIQLRLSGLKANQYKQVSGMYKGQSEDSYVVDAIHLEKVIELAIENKQESILLLDETRQASLLFLNDMTRLSIGQFKAVPKHVSLSSDNLTWDSSTDIYYVVEAV